MTLALKLQSNKLNEREYFVVNDKKVKRKKKEGIQYITNNEDNQNVEIIDSDEEESQDNIK